MKGSRSLLAMSIAITVAIAPPAIAVPKTTAKAAGRVTTTVVNTILNGFGAPSKAVGIDGDFYIDTKNLNLYGPKVKGVWKVGTSLKQADSKSVTTVIGEPGSIGDRGPQGDRGDKGATGNTGATGSAGLNGAVGATGANGIDGEIGAPGIIGATGAKGDTGLTGAVGAQGVKGDAGTNGASGAQGTKGDAGTNGTAGLNGSAGAQGTKGDAGTNGASGSNGSAGAQGIKGDTGSSGAAGTQGIKGDAGTIGTQGTQGIKGDAGTTGTQGTKGDAGTTGTQGVQGETGTAGAPGAAGISVSYFVDLGTWTLSTDVSVGTSDSNTFINLGTGSYTFEILVDGTFSPDTSAAMTIGMQVISSAGTLDFRAFASDSAAYINNYGNRHYQFLIIGKIVCTGATTLKMRAIDQHGATGNNLLIFTGRALINKVGSIG